jgi:hypothetical protein
LECHPGECPVEGWGEPDLGVFVVTSGADHPVAITGLKQQAAPEGHASYLGGELGDDRAVFLHWRRRDSADVQQCDIGHRADLMFATVGLRLAVCPIGVRATVQAMLLAPVPSSHRQP